MRIGPYVLGIGGLAAATGTSGLAIVLLVIVIVSIGFIEMGFQRHERAA